MQTKMRIYKGTVSRTMTYTAETREDNNYNNTNFANAIEYNENTQKTRKYTESRTRGEVI